MRVAGAGHILGARAELHGDRDLSDQRAGIRPDDVRAQHAVRVLVGENLHEAVHLAHGARAAIRHEGELADLVARTARLQLLLGLADARHLGPGVDDARDDAVVHMAMLAGQHLGQRDAFLLGLVGQHRADDDIADRPDAGDVGREMRVGLHAAAFVQRDAGFREAEPLHIGAAADGQQHDISLQRLRRAAGGRLERERHAVLGLLRAGDLGLELELHPLLAEDLLEGLPDLGVHAGHQAVEIFHHRHLGAEAAPHAAELEPDIAAADDDHVARHLRELEPAGGGDDLRLIHLDAGQRDAFGARGDDDVLGVVGGIAHRHLAGGGHTAFALQPGDLVLLEQELDALGVGADDLTLAGLHLLEVERDGADIDAMLGELVLRLVEMLRGLQQRLGGDAADIEAGAAECRALFHAGDLHAELGGADRADIAAGTGADDDDVEAVSHNRVLPSFLGRTIRTAARTSNHPGSASAIKPGCGRRSVCRTTAGAPRSPPPAWIMAGASRGPWR